MLYDNILTKAGTAVLRALCRHPYRDFYPSELAKASGISITHVLRLLAELKKLNVVSEKRAGKRGRFRLDIENMLTAKLIGLFSLERRMELPPSFRAPIEEFVKKMRAKASSIILFGSVAKGLQNKESDIDLFIISKDAKKSKEETRKIMEELFGFYQLLIEEHIFSEKEFDSMHRKGNDLLINLIKDGIILHDNGFYLHYLKKLPEPSKELVADILELAKQSLKTAEKIISISHEDAIEPLRKVARDCCRALLLINGVVPGSKHEIAEQVAKIDAEYSSFLKQVNDLYYKYMEKSEKIERKTVASCLARAERLLRKTLEDFAGD